MTTVVISQPMYFPWPGFLAQLAIADVVVWLVDVQFSKGSFTNRVQVRTPGGRSWLSIPLLGKGSKTAIMDLTAAKPDWLDGHLATLRQSLRHAPHAATALETASSIAGHARLCDALIASSETLARACGIPTPQTCLSTDLAVPGDGSDRVLGIVNAVGGTRYVTGHGARNYLDHTGFADAGVAVDYMDYAVTAWRDSADFSPYVTGLDLLAHTGGAAARAYLNPQTIGWQDFLTRSG